MALSDLRLCTLAHRYREAQERCTLHHVLLRLLRLLGHDAQPGTVQRAWECGAEYRIANSRCTAGSTKVEHARPNFRRNPRSHVAALARVRSFCAKTTDTRAGSSSLALHNPSMSVREILPAGCRPGT